ncbi:MAG: hypothetical protein NT154_09415 [Verrucomicrobia bacterium]|nr:hypothetical protein [Verrucomicrobiota bacterium]
MHPQELSATIFWSYVGGRMPRKIPLSDVEVAICSRLKLYRQRCDLPRRLFARDSGLDTAVIIRLELGRTPLRYGVASRITRAFSINPVWLATGEGDISAHVPLPFADDIGADERELFSSVFRGKLRESVSWKVAKIELDPAHKYGRQEHPTDAKGRVFAEEFLRMDIRDWLTSVSDARFNDLINAIRYAGMPFANDWDPAHDALEVVAKRRAEMEIERVRLQERRAHLASLRPPSSDAPREKIKSKPTVDTLAAPDIMPGVNSETGYWGALVKRVRVLTTAPGGKAQLARELNTTRQAVNKWLSGKGAPSAEITLRLLQWVVRHEQKQNTLGSAINTTKGKTQVRKSGYEKQAQVRKNG